MRIKRLSLHGFKCFVKESILELDDKAYAVVARHISDPSRSNWLGKSSLFEAIDFALFGRHSHRTEDGWISHGESEGGVQIVFDDGSVITRSRKRGKSTRVSYRTDSNDEGATQAEAELKITQATGLDAKDFSATCFLEQREMARLIRARSDERMGIVSGWLGLDPLQAAEENLREQVSALSLAMATTWRNKHVLETRRECALKSVDVTTEEELTEAIEKTILILNSAKSKFTEVQNGVKEDAARVGIKERAAEYAKIVEEGSKLSKLINARDKASLVKEAERLKVAHDKAFSENALLFSAEQQKRSLAAGNFDGHCPIAPIDCPVRDTINEDRVRNERLHSEAKKDLMRASEVMKSAGDAYRANDNKVTEIRDLEQRLTLLRERAKALQPDHVLAKKFSGETVDRHDDYVQSQNVVVDAKTRLNALIAAKDEWKSSDPSKHVEQLAKEEARLNTLREALVIFGKQGAQRRVAESALTQIQDSANGVLRECGIDLSIDVQWSREGASLAKSCDSCGHPFPSSAKVKVCERCQAPRGPQLVNKLDVVLSDRSGAAEDLAGFAFRFAASQWLRADRMSAWSAALIDEPFGQLDESHRKSLSSHLSTMLGAGRYGFDQAFVIAHHSSVLDALPGRILIESDGKHSTARVIV